MKIQFVIFAILISSSAFYSQNGLKEFKKTIDVYKTIKQMSFEVEVFAYETKASPLPQFLGKGFAKKQDNFFYSKFGENEMLQNEGKTVVINTDQRQIDYYEYNMAAVKKSQVGFSMSEIIDSLSTQNDSSFVYEGVKGGYKRFSKATPGEVIEKTEFQIDPLTNLVTKITYYYADSNEDYDLPFKTVVIHYKNLKMDPVPRSYFELTKFVQNQGGKYIGGSNYKGFKVFLHKSKQNG